VGWLFLFSWEEVAFLVKVISRQKFFIMKKIKVKLLQIITD